MGILNGKVAAVTGAGRGLGRSHALALAKEGAKIVVNDFGVAMDGSGKASGPADDVVMEIKDAGGGAVANYVSVIDFQGTKSIINDAVRNFGRLDILVNNAGFLRDRMSFKMSEEEWDMVVDVHLKRTFNTGRWATEYFREQHKAGSPIKGRIINTISHAAIIGNVGQPNYAAAKAGIAALTVTWAREMEKYGITSNAICPMARTRHTIQTDSISGMFAEVDEGQFDGMAPDNISPLVAYLASDDAQNITGHIFAIRGGKLDLFVPWQIENTIDIGRSWTVDALREQIRNLGDLGMPAIVI